MSLNTMRGSIRRSEAAAATQLPAPTVAKLMARLCREGLLTSTRGVKGGYQLARPAAEIPVAAIVNALLMVP